MNALIRIFWWNTGLAAALAALLIHVWWAPQWRLLPSAPFPFSRTTYLNLYADEGIASHYLYWFGLFGFGQRLKNSDVILIGTSHVWFGLSASLLADKLSAAEGHPVRVMNMGMGYADEAFQFHALERNHIVGKTVIVDLYGPAEETISVWAAEVEKADWVTAYIQVLKIWSDGIRDWCLDPFLPRCKIDASGPVVTRTFGGGVVCRWDTDDAEYIWYPQLGFFYRRGTSPLPGYDNPPGPTPGTSEARFWGAGNRGIDLPLTARRVMASNHLRPILVMIPFNSYRPELAVQIADESHSSLVLIPPEGLRFFDWNHLTAPSRDVATSRLFDEIEHRNLISFPSGH